MATFPDTFQLALQKHMDGQVQEADSLFSQILLEDPNHAETHYFKGLSAYQQQNYTVAIGFLNRAIELKSHIPVFYNGLGNAYYLAGELEEAKVAYEKALELDPRNSEVLNNLGSLMHKLEKYPEALLHFTNSLEINPYVADVYLNMANTLKEMELYSEAVTQCFRAVHFRPEYAEAYFNIGYLFQKLYDDKAENPEKYVNDPHNYLEQAVSNYVMGLELHPDDWEAYYNLGNAFKLDNQQNEALLCYNKCLELNPEFAPAHNNLGFVLRGCMQIEVAVECYKRALSIQPDFPEAHFNLAVAYLLLGNFKEGWHHYEWRNSKRLFTQGLSQPVWDGTPFAGKTLLVRSEQGYGDTFQFIRYLPWVKSLGGKVVFECQPGLKPILNGCIGIDQLIERTSNLEEPGVAFDLHIPLLSLPGLFQSDLSNIPAPVPYLFSPEALSDKWQSRLSNPGSNQLKIGIVWAGSVHNKHGLHRACPIEHFATLAERPDVKVYSIQKGPSVLGGQPWSEQDLTPYNITNLGPDLVHFAETAGIIANLDLIISVDTSVAHLAGAMGKPVWTLLPFVPDWRWMLEMETSPWYPTMKLFRQPDMGDWSGLFKQVHEALDRFNK